VFFIVTVAENVAPATTVEGTDWLTKIAALGGRGVPVAVGEGVSVPAGVFVRVGVGVAVGVRVGVKVAVAVGVDVGPPGVGVDVLVGVFVGVFAGAGVAEAVTAIVALPLLFDMTGSASLPTTPATTLSGPACWGVTLITTAERPLAGQITVVDGSPPAELAAQPTVESDGLNATAGWKIAMTATPDAPVGAHSPTRTVKGAPIIPPVGARIPVTARS
jgi:hypothetical protein